MHAHGAVHAARHHAEAHRHEQEHGHHEHGHGRAHGHHDEAQAESHAPHANGTARPDGSAGVDAEPEPESLAWEPRWQKGQRTDAIARELRWRRWVLEDNVMETIWMEVSPANAS